MVVEGHHQVIAVAMVAAAVGAVLASHAILNIEVCRSGEFVVDIEKDQEHVLNAFFPFRLLTHLAKLFEFIVF